MPAVLSDVPIDDSLVITNSETIGPAAVGSPLDVSYENAFNVRVREWYRPPEILEIPELFEFLLAFHDSVGCRTRCPPSDVVVGASEVGAARPTVGDERSAAIAPLINEFGNDPS